MDAKKHIIKPCSKIDFLNIIRSFATRYKLLSITYSSLLIIFPVKNIVVPIIIGLIYEKLKAKQTVGPIMFILLVVIMILQIMSVVLDIFDIKLFVKLQQHIRNLLLNHVFNITSSNYAEVKSGDVIVQVIKFPYVAYGFIESWLSTYIPFVLTSISTIAYLLYINRIVGILVAITFFVISYIFYYSFKKCQCSTQKRDSIINNVYGRIDDTLKNVKTVLSHNAQEYETQRINEHNSTYEDLSYKSILCSLRSKYLALSVLGIFFTIVCCMRILKNGVLGFKFKVSTGAFITFCIIIVSTYNAVNTMSWHFKGTIMRWGTIKNSLKLINDDCDNQNKTIDNTITTDKNTIEDEENTNDSDEKDNRGITIVNLSFGYEANKTILHNLNVKFKHNSINAIVGDIGSGKSTLTNLILKYYALNSGDIYINGVSYKNISEKSIRKQISYLPQNPILFDRSIFDNIVYGTSNTTRQDVYDMITKLSLDDFMAKFEKGIDTNVGVNGSKLSGGQRQIVWIIKIALMNPPIIILDEPTASLNPESKSIVRSLIRNIVTNKTIILITHDQYLINNSDNVFTMVNGNLEQSYPNSN